MEKINLTAEERKSIMLGSGWREAVQECDQQRKKLKERITVLNGTITAATETVKYMTSSAKSEILVKIQEDEENIPLYNVHIGDYECGIRNVDQELYQKLLIQAGFTVNVRSLENEQIGYHIVC